jgi:hypothetical protein
VVTLALAVAGDAGVFRVRHYGAADFVGISALLQNFVALEGMVFEVGPGRDLLIAQCFQGLDLCCPPGWKVRRE